MAILIGGDAGIQQGQNRGIFSALSDFAESIVQQWNGAIPVQPKERVFVDDGFSNVPGTSFVGSTIDNVDDIKTRHVATQEPSLTVYIKKRAFWGLSSANDSRFMDSGEKLFIRASKILFERKCNQIATYEALTKLNRLVSEDADLDADAIGLVIQYLETYRDNQRAEFEQDAELALGSSATPEDFAVVFEVFEDELSKLEDTEGEINKYISELEILEKKQRKLSQSTNTTWVIDPDDPDVFFMGRGAGVIELTLVSSVDTNLGLESVGSVNLSIEDPYNLMKITTDDVEISLAAANAELESLAKKDYSVLVGPGQHLDAAKEAERELRALRKNRISGFYGMPQSIVENSEAAEIIFEVRAGSYAKDKVVAYTSANSSVSYNKDNLLFAMLDLPLEQQLTSEEQGFVDTIFKELNEYVEQVERLNADLNQLNSSEDVKYARRQLRKHYLGKSIIQPMDSVHVYMRGNTYRDGSVVGPLSGLLNNTAFIRNYSNDLEVSDEMIRSEMKILGVSNVLDIELYKSIRTGSFMRNAGMHVFGGLIKSVSESYNASNGTYTLAVSGASNLRWLELSRVNVSPSLDQFQGILEDPLTPFSIKTDPATGLIDSVDPLPQNARALQDNLLRDKNGVNVGKTITEKNVNQDHVLVEGEVLPVFQHAPGIVYKWKEGTMVVTLDTNLQKPQSGETVEDQRLQRHVKQKVVDNPFAGLDAADIVSVLVTGYPHSAQRFYDAAKTAGTLNVAGSNSYSSYFHSIFDITRSTNKVLGNFEPFRSIDFGGTNIAKTKSFQGTLYKSYNKLNRLRKELATAQDELNAINISILSKDKPKETGTINRDKARESKEVVVNGLIKQIADEKKNIQKAQDQAVADGVIKNTNDIIFDLQGRPSGIESQTVDEQRKNVRLKNKIVQFRPQLDCKFNRDKNLFVVSDEYDTNTSIQAYVLEMLKGDQQLFKSEYKDPLKICKEVAEILNFEFFCDTNGHLVFRPQQYNRIPLSLILKMFLLNDKKSVQLYPDFLKHLFESRLQSTKNDIEVLGYEIERQALLLNLTIVDPNKLAHRVIDEASQDLSNEYFIDSGSEPDVSKSTVDRILKLTDNMVAKTGIKSKYSDRAKIEEALIDYNSSENPQANSLRLTAFNDLKSMISRRDRLRSIEEKLDAQGKKYDVNTADFDREKLNSLLSPFSNLIEDDYNDFFGPGSGKRFIIYDDQIISYQFTESDDNANCRVDVSGQENLVGGPGELVAGIRNLEAGATDFDIWRQYGYRSLGSFNKPFLKNAEEQCAPYAMFLLSRARKDILRGTVTVYGNEYYQLGDVVYINSRDMLFYVTDISHKFDYGSGSFTTTLTLRYGRTLGEYIPTPFDVIGEGLIKNQRKFNKIIVNRETSSKYTGVHLGLVVFENDPTNDEMQAMLTEPFARFNVTQLKRSLLTASNILASNKASAFPKVEVRGWYIDESNKDKVEERMNIVIEWLREPRGRYVKNYDNYIIIDDQYYDAALQENHIHNLVLMGPEKPEGSTVIAPINLSEDLKGDDLKFNRTPNEEVYNAIIDGSLDPTNIIEMVLVFEEQK